MTDPSLIPADYAPLLAEIKTRVRHYVPQAVAQLEGDTVVPQATALFPAELLPYTPALFARLILDSKAGRYSNQSHAVIATNGDLMRAFLKTRF